MIPMEVRFGEEEYLDGVNLTPKEFCNKLIESAELPKTSQVNPYRFEEVYEQIVSNGDSAVVITISSKLSGTYRSACQATNDYKDKIFVVDSLNACIGERLLILYAIKLIEQGKTAQEIAEELNKVKSKINVMAMLNTLKYLKKGGRISAVTAFAGEVFSIKPVIGIVEGEVKMIGKAIGSKKGNNLLNTLVEKKGGIDFSMPFGVVWSGTDESVLIKYVEDSAHLWEGYVENVPAYMIGSTIGTHVGPGAIGVAFFEK
jgi:DegV family protein with EDD domain